MRITILSWRDLAHPQAGGSEIVVDRLAAGLQTRGHQVQLVAGRPVGMREYPVFPSGGTFGQYLRTPVIARRSLRETDLIVDISNGVPFFAPAWSRKPVICLVHHIHGQQWRDYFPAPVAAMGSFAEQHVVPRLYARQHFVGISRSTCQELAGLGIPQQRIHLVENGLDHKVLNPEPHEKSPTPLFLALGRIAVNKRLDLLLDMWERVRETTGGQLVIAGDGPELGPLRARRVPGVEFTGRIDEVAKRSLLARAWLLVHTAPREGWGLVVMEAAACGTPTLGFDVAGVRDTVLDGQTGHLAQSQQDFEARWTWLSCNEAERRRLGQQARDRAGAYTWDRSVACFERAAQAAVSRVR